jgi:hypothetical protein
MTEPIEKKKRNIFIEMRIRDTSLGVTQQELQRLVFFAGDVDPDLLHTEIKRAIEVLKYGQSTGASGGGGIGHTSNRTGGGGSRSKPSSPFKAGDKVRVLQNGRIGTVTCSGIYGKMCSVAGTNDPDQHGDFFYYYEALELVE